MGWRSCSNAIALQDWKSLPAPCSPLTFLVTYLGPGFGSMPSSVRSRIHVSEGLMSLERSVVSSLEWFLLCLGLLVYVPAVWPIMRGCL